MNTKLKIAICTAFISVGFQMHAQVGIGVATPNAFSILDLTQTGSGVKGVLLPIGDVTPNSVAARPEAMIIYYQDQVYVKQVGGFNAMNPWKYKFNGNTTEDLSFNPTSLVGVGIGVNTGNIFGRMHISATGKDVTATGNNANSAALFIGDATSATHMIFDADEIMVKATNTTGGLLKLQEEDGSIQIGNDRVEAVDAATIHLHTTIGSTTNRKNINVTGKVRESGNDLLPVGSIIMWSGPAVPAGWALCDGGTYAKVDGSGSIVTPNLSGRSIIATGSNGTGTAAYTYGSSAGTDSKVLTTANLPYHSHTGTTSTDGNHTHTYQDDFRNTTSDGGGGGAATRAWHGNQGGQKTTSSDGGHGHTVTTNACVGCNATPVDSRSAYYVLTFIMKL